MLRCTLSGLIPLMMSSKYQHISESLFKEYSWHFNRIIEHKSYYLLRMLPRQIAYELLSPVLDNLLSSQKKNGMWKIKDTERITYDVLRILKELGLLARIKHSPVDYLKEKQDIYSLLIKKDIFGIQSSRDSEAIQAAIQSIAAGQQPGGSWEDTIVGTVVNIEMLLDLGMDKDDLTIKHGVQYLFANFNNELAGIHTTNTYGFKAKDMFSSPDRNLEFETALKLKPEWIPRNVCFRHLAVIQSSVCLNLFLRLGMESDAQVSAALDNIYNLLEAHGGLCTSDIKKPYMEQFN